MKKTLLLYGGGIDSSALLAYLEKLKGPDNVEAVFFRYGQKAEQLEYEACAYMCARYSVPLTVVAVPFSTLTDSAIMRGGELAVSPSVNIVDGRNLTFISLAGMYAAKVGATEIALGYHVEPVARPFPDATTEFLDAVNVLIPRAFVHQFEIVAPFKDWTRHQIFKWAQETDLEIIEHAHTCYEDVDGGCGECSHCVLKEQILKEI
jgi:7-cyano-7-deazaguanine synthase